MAMAVLPCHVIIRCEKALVITQRKRLEIRPMSVSLAVLNSHLQNLKLTLLVGTQHNAFGLLCFTQHNASLPQHSLEESPG